MDCGWRQIPFAALMDCMTGRRKPNGVKLELLHSAGVAERVVQAAAELSV